jgi:hypothetical protein
MWTIFHEAKYVAAWLGLAADDSDLVLAQIADIPEMQTRDIGRYPSLGWLQKFVNWRPPTDFLSLFAFSALVKHPYWRRVWIQQELQASENFWFHCGRKRIHLSLIGLVSATGEDGNVIKTIRFKTVRISSWLTMER